MGGKKRRRMGGRWGVPVGRGGGWEGGGEYR